MLAHRQGRRNSKLLLGVSRPCLPSLPVAAVGRLAEVHSSWALSQSALGESLAIYICMKRYILETTQRLNIPTWNNMIHEKTR